MPDFDVTAPDGKTYRVSAPAGATQDQALAYAKQHYAELKASNPVRQANARPADSALTSFAKATGAGASRLVFGAEELAGKGLEAVGATQTGRAMVDQARLATSAVDAAMAPDRQAHPIATTAGEIAGSAAITGPAGAVRGAALQGALQPVGTDKDYWRTKATETGISTALGAALGKVGGATATRAEGAAAAQDPAMAMLVKAGVKLTPGQAGGKVANDIEQKLTSVPVTGLAIQSARNESVRSFNIATINKALEPIGEKLSPKAEAGYKAVGQMQQKISAAYDKLLPKLTFRADQPLADDFQKISGMAAELPPPQRDTYQAILTNRIARRLAPNGTMNGETFNEVDGELGHLAKIYTTSPDGAQRLLGNALREVQESLRDALERQNPENSARLADIRKSFAMSARVDAAAANRVKSAGVFTPGDLLAASKRGDASARRKAFARGDALLQEWGAAGEKYLGSTVPDSGTAGRSALLGAGGVALNPALGIPLAVKAATGAAGYYAANRLAQMARQNPGAVGNALAPIIRQAAPYVAAGAAQGAVGQ